mgnify:CR=1 FL=1
MSFQADIETEHWENYECPKRCKEEAIKFAEWLLHNDNGDIHYNPKTKETSPSIGFSPFDCFIDETKSAEELYKLFKDGK